LGLIARESHRLTRRDFSNSGDGFGARDGNRCRNCP
jgi:hypothetical protein